MNIDNINMAETENDKNDDIAKSNNNDDNPIMSDKESPLESPANDNIENDEVDENSTEEVPSPLMAEKQMTQQKSSPQKGTDLSRSHPWNLQWAIHKKIKIKMPQLHQILMYLILMTYEYMHSSWKENQKVKN